MLHPGRASLVDGGVAIARGRASSIRTRGIVQQLEALIAEKSSQRWSAGASMIDDASGDHPSPGVNAKALVATGWDAIDRALAPASPQCDTDALAKLARGGLSRGAIHEWFGGGGEEGKRASRGRWLPPHTLLIHLAWRAIDSGSTGLVVWIGRRVWPHACALARFTTENTEFTERDFGFARKRLAWIPPDLNVPSSSVPSVFSVVNLISQSIFLDLPDDASRLWAIDLALRNPAVNVVISDGSRFRMAESRRLQLAAERGRTLALIARPSWEAAELSAAATRWRVCRTPSPSLAPRWIVELLRCKYQGRSGIHASLASTAAADADANANEKRGWEVEYAAPGHLRLVADVVDRSDPKTMATTFERAG
jgi:hypothetical protein